MLRLLRVRNLAVIESVEVEFDAGFNVLTGETGAGKSILIEAVGLLLGGRASIDLIRTGESHASIEALFELAAGTEVVVRREITAQGRSRAFIDGALATAAALRDLSQRLVELHGQHEHQQLLDPLMHLPLLDEQAGLGPRVAEVSAAWTELTSLRSLLERSQMDAREKAARLELITFQLSEIDRAAPKPGEDEELATTRQVLASAERIRRLCDESYATLYDSDAAVLPLLGGVWKRLAELAAIDPAFGAHLDGRDGIKSQLEDLALFLRDYGERVDTSPGRLQEVDDRLVALERLKRKYGPTLADVLARSEGLRQERDRLEAPQASAAGLQSSLRAATDSYLAQATALSRQRRAAAGRFAPALEQLLGELAMPGARFEVRFADDARPEHWGDRGLDRAEFYLSANPGEQPRPLARIVSGGELSRVMLALKTMAATASVAPGDASRTIVFDEVDAGIGGRVADVVADRLARLGARFQVLCITHLPQIAARATTQFRIEKQVRANRTRTTVERLDEDGRVEELARMIAGAAVTGPVRDTARAMLAGPRPSVASPSASRQGRGRKANP